jgi:hypothetical protein
MEGGGGSVALSDDTKKRVAAAKSYIENMYKVQHQNIQERYARRVTVYACARVRACGCVCGCVCVCVCVCACVCSERAV